MNRRAHREPASLVEPDKPRHLGRAAAHDVAHGVGIVPAQPLVGYGDTRFRAYLNEPWITSFASPIARQIIYAGPHNELLANLLRSGIAGGIAIVALFVAPFMTFWRARRYGARARVAAEMGLAVSICLIFASVLFEMFTLKYKATFNGLLIAGLAGQVLAERAQARSAAEQTVPGSNVRCTSTCVGLRA